MPGVDGAVASRPAGLNVGFLMFNSPRMNLTTESKQNEAFGVSLMESFEAGHSPFKFIHASVLVVMNPSHAVKVTNASHVLGQLLGFGPGEVVDDRDDVAVSSERGNDFLSNQRGKCQRWRSSTSVVSLTYPVNPILAVGVLDAPFQRAWRQNQEEMFRLLDALQQVVVELASLEALDVNEDAEAAQLQVNFQETRQLRSVAAAVGHEHV